MPSSQDMNQAFRPTLQLLRAAWDAEGRWLV